MTSDGSDRVQRYADGNLSVILDVTTKRNGNAMGQQRSSSGECVDVDVPAFILQFQAINRNDVRDRDEQMVLHECRDSDKGNGCASSLLGFI